MKNFLTSLLGSLVALAIFSIGALICLLVLLAIIGSLASGGDRDGPARVENGAYVVFNMSVNITDAPAQFDSNALLTTLAGGDRGPRQMQLREITQSLQAIATDKRIAGVFLYGSFEPDALGTGYAALKEIRDALEQVRAAKKTVIFYLADATAREMYLASMGDEIVLDPYGMLNMPGLATEQPYFAGALEKFGVGVQVTRVGKYKSAVEPFTRADMSAESREETQKLLDDIWDEVRGAIAKGRGLTDAALQQLVDKEGIITPALAVKRKLVTRVAYRDEVIDDLKTRTGRGGTTEPFKQVSLADYARTVSMTSGYALALAPEPTPTPATELADKNDKNDASDASDESDQSAQNSQGDKRDAKDKDTPALHTPTKPPRSTRAAQGTIAIVYAEGTIVDGEGDTREIGGERYARQLRRLRQDDTVKAIVLRVNSPGGSATASEHIQRELRLAKQEKPVIVSMGAYAASGGYWISTAADRIFAQPDTITGSIGVFGLQADVQKLAGNLGVTFDGVKTGKFAGSETITRPKTADELAVAQRLVDWIYDQFVAKVSESRNLTPDRVQEIAQGRVWSGAEAQKLGLVDDLGGLDDALACAAQRAGLSGVYRVREFPRKKEFSDFFHSLLGGGRDTTPDQTALRAAPRGALDDLLARFKTEARILNEFNDPKGIYARLPLDQMVK